LNDRGGEESAVMDNIIVGLLLGLAMLPPSPFTVGSAPELAVILGYHWWLV